MEQQADNTIIDLRSLDLFLHLVPEPNTAAAIRDQILQACRHVEARGDEVKRLNAEYEAKIVEVEAMKGDLEAKKGSIANEQIKLMSIAEKTSALPGRVDELVKRFDQMSLDTAGVTVAVNEDLKAVTKLKDRIDLLVNDVHQMPSSLKQETSAMVTSAQQTAQSQAEKSFQTIKEHITEKVNGINETSTSTGEKLAKELVKTNHEIMALTTSLGTLTDTCRNEFATAKMGVREEFTSSIQPLITRIGRVETEVTALPQATGDVARSSLEPFLERIQNIHTTLTQLPSAKNISDIFEDAGKMEYFTKSVQLRERHVQLQEEVNQLRVENRALRSDTANVRIEAAEVTTLASDARDMALRDLEAEKGRGSRRDNKIEELRGIVRTLRERWDEAQHHLQVGAGVEQRLQATEDRLQIAEAASETAEATCKETCDQLRQSQSLVQQLSREKLALQSDVDHEKKLNKACSEQLTQVRSQLEDAKASQDQVSKSCEERADQLASTFESFKGLQGELKKAWETERDGLKESVSHERSLRESKEETLELTRSKVNALDCELTEVKNKAQLLERELTGAKNKAQSLEHENAKFQAEVNSSKITLNEMTTKAAKLEQDLITATAHIKTAEDQIAARITVPRGVTGDLAKMYLRLADEFRDIPTVPETIDGLDMSTVAIEIAPILDQYNAKEYLVAFLDGRHQGWHCLSQVLNGHPSEIDQGVCATHRIGCMKVRVGGVLIQELEFKND
ncbi:hypothetical protein FGRMN_3258 [Fusarium graminum]|nr:hypothetical protein FGRMN_3258 [Fusarium graminum]